MNTSVEGQLYREGSAGCLTVTVGFDHGQLVIHSEELGELSQESGYQDFSVSDKLGSTPREVTFANGHMLSLPGTDMVDSWFASHKDTSALGQMEKSRRMTLLALLLIPLSLFVIYRYAIPQAAIYFAAWVPDSVSEIASEQTLYTMDKTILDPSAIPMDEQQKLTSKWLDTIKQLKLSKYYYDIQFRQSDVMGANAFALPNGTIVITDDLVKLVENNDQMLLAVLLHEIGHVERHHSMRLVAQSIASAVVINYMIGDFSGFADLFAGGTTTIVQNNFSQTLEWEADNFALEQLDVLHLPRDTFAQAMEKLAESVGEESQAANLLSTHPLMRERIENARKGKAQ